MNESVQGTVGLRDAESAAAALVLGPQALSSFPEPALVVAADGTVTLANDRAGPLAAALAEGLLPEAVALIGQVARSGAATTEIAVLGGDGGPQMLELVLLPLIGQVLVLAKDVSLEYNLRAALVESRQRYKDLVQISSDFAWEVGADGLFSFVSPKGALGWTADQLVGRDPLDFLIEPPGAGGTPFTATGMVEDVELWMRGADGLPACLVAAAAPLLGPQGEPLGVRGVCRDVTAERTRDDALARANNRERLLTYIVRTIRDVVEPSDMLGAAADAMLRALAACGCQIFRVEGASGVFLTAAEHGKTGNPQAVVAAFASADRYEGEIDGRRVLATVSRYHQQVNGAVVLWREADSLPWDDDDRLLIGDIANQIGIANEQIVNHERIVTLSRTDALTGLFNRRAFFEELGRRFNRLERDARPAALFYVDLDNFKLVNDVHGHARGDEVLLAVRDLLVASTRPVDLVARLGGDEFAVWLDGADHDAALSRARALIDAGHSLARHSGDAARPLHLSLGVAVHDPAHPETMQALIGRADQAMYEAKRDGKGNWRLAPPAGEAGGAEP